MTVFPGISKKRLWKQLNPDDDPNKMCPDCYATNEPTNSRCRNCGKKL